MNLSEILKRHKENDFSPARMRECAEMLRSWDGRGKKKALKFAEMLEDLAKHEEWKRAQIRASYERPEYRPNYDEHQ